MGQISRFLIFQVSYIRNFFSIVDSKFSLQINRHFDLSEIEKWCFLMLKSRQWLGFDFICLAADRFNIKITCFAPGLEPAIFNKTAEKSLNLCLWESHFIVIS